MSSPTLQAEPMDLALTIVSAQTMEDGGTTPESAEKAVELPPLETLRITRDDGKLELPEAYCQEKLGFAFSTGKKWRILCAIFIVQSSMNFNASVYGNAVVALREEFDLSATMARVGQMIFLVAYGFGSELWAPWSEEYGRFWVMQLSLFFVNLWAIPCALAPNYATIIAGRFLGGLSSAGGSVTLGMVADMYDVEDHQYALNFLVLSSCSGSALGPIFGSFVERYMSWHWVFWIQLIFGFAAQLTHFMLVTETRQVTLIDRQARQMRKENPEKFSHVYGPGELGPKMDRKQVFTIWIRPFAMFIKEPIVCCLSLLSGFSDALIFLFIDSFHDVFSQWGFGIIQMGMTFVPIVIGYLVSFASFFYPIGKHNRIRREDPRRLQPEARLWWLLYLAPLLTIGLFCFAWSSFGPPGFHWIAPMSFAFLLAIANYAIYMATVDYMVAAYGEYSASATGGNALARDVLAGVAAMVSTPLYNNIGSKKWHLIWPGLILGCLSFVVTIPVYIIYRKGPAIRAKSNFACKLAADRIISASRRGTLVALSEVAEINRRFGSTVEEALGLPPRDPNDAIAEESRIGERVS